MIENAGRSSLGPESANIYTLHFFFPFFFIYIFIKEEVEIFIKTSKKPNFNLFTETSILRLKMNLSYIALSNCF